MAVYRFSAQVIGRSTGRSATGAAAYRAGVLITDERTGDRHDYRRRGGVVHSEIIAPDNSPDFVQDRASLWNAVEQAERRKDAQLAREILMSLPHELNEDERGALIKGFVENEFVSRGMVADLAIHAPDREGDNRNHHAHVMLTMRSLSEDGFGKKDRSWNETSLLEHWRERWAEEQNAALERSGYGVRVDHRSLEDQGIDREPEPKLGAIATDMERNGKRSKVGDDLREVWRRNGEQELLHSEKEAVMYEYLQESLSRSQKALHAKDENPPEGGDFFDLFETQRAVLAKECAIQEEIIEDYVTKLEGRGRLAVWWDKLRGRLGWHAEQDYQAEQMKLQELQRRQEALEDAQRQEERRQEEKRRHDLAMRDQEIEFFKKQQAKRAFDQGLQEGIKKEQEQQERLKRERELNAYAEQFQQTMQRNQDQVSQQDVDQNLARSERDEYLEQFTKNLDRKREQDRDLE